MFLAAVVLLLQGIAHTFRQTLSQQLPEYRSFPKTPSVFAQDPQQLVGQLLPDWQSVHPRSGNSVQ